MNEINLILAGIELPREVFPTSQTYRRVDGGSSLLRTRGGDGVPQSHWQKLAVEIAGEGWAPPALAELDWSASFVLACIAPRGIASATVSVTLPSARRADLAVNEYAHAVVAGQLVETPVSVVGDAATCTAVAGATGYVVHYYPLLTVWSRGPQEALDTARGVYGWSLTAEEI